jgi:hypothetical protein
MSNANSARSVSAEPSTKPSRLPPRRVRGGGGRARAPSLFAQLWLGLLLSSCGIPDYPFLGPPLSGYSNDPNDTFTFSNNPDTSPIFDGYVLMYRIYERQADIAADIASIGALDPQLDGASTKLKLASLGFYEISPGIDVDPSFYDVEFQVEINFGNPESVTVSSPTYVPSVEVFRNGYKGFDEINPSDVDVKAAASPEVPDEYYSIAIFACARGLDLTSTINTYYSQFTYLSNIVTTIPTTE